MLLFQATMVFSEAPGQPPARDESRFEATAGRLNLTAEQKEKISALRQSQREQMKALFQELRAKREQIKSELNNPKATRESIAPLAAELKEIQSKMIDLRIDNIFAIKETLSSDQIGKLQQFRQKCRGDERGRRPFWLERRRAKMIENTKEEVNPNE